jgi:hypothetical protein
MISFANPSLLEDFDGYFFDRTALAILHRWFSRSMIFTDIFLALPPKQEPT